MLDLLKHRNSVKPFISKSAVRGGITRTFTKIDNGYEMLISGGKYTALVLISSEHLEKIKACKWISTKNNIVCYFPESKKNVSISKFIYGKTRNTLARRINDSDMNVYDFRKESVKHTNLGVNRIAGITYKFENNTSGKTNVYCYDNKWTAVIRDNGRQVTRSFSENIYLNAYHMACDMYDQMVELKEKLISKNGSFDIDVFREHVRLLEPKTKF